MPLETVRYSWKSEDPFISADTSFSHLLLQTELSPLERDRSYITQLLPVRAWLPVWNGSGGFWGTGQELGREWGSSFRENETEEL